LFTDKENAMNGLISMSSLNDVMEIDHVIQVHEDGTITDAPQNVWAPSLYDDELDDDRWSLMKGYSGQYSYSGPIMHPSEFIGGRMEDDIREAPGYYVALVNVDLDDEEAEAGWAVAYRPA
jgi:hypothetical protein